MDVANNTVFITGANRGLGLAFAREALRRCLRADPMLKDASRSGRARPVQDGVHHGQAIQGTPTLQP